jgi:hypothetical protein
VISGKLETTGFLSVAADNQDLKVGAGDDIRIFHDGTDSRIYNATGNLVLRSAGYFLNSADGSENIIKGLENGAVELYHDNSKKFETNANGVKITNSPSGGTSGAIKINTDLANYGHIIVRDKNQYQTSALNVENENDGTDETCYIYRAVDLGSSTWANARMTAKSHRFQISADTAGSNEKLKIDSNGIKVVGQTNSTYSTTGIRVNSDLITYGGVTVRDHSNSTQSNHIACFQAENSSSGTDTTNIVTRSVDLNSANWANAKYVAKTHKFTCNDSIDANIKVRIDSDGLKFNTDSAAANALNDYEEGTFTPVISLGRTGSITYHQQTGFYTKIGNRVFCQIYMNISGGNNDSNALYIDGLPFNCVNITSYEGGGYHTYQGGFFTNSAVTDNHPWIAINNNRVNFHRTDNGSAVTGNDTSTSTNYLIFHVQYVTTA